MHRTLGTALLLLVFSGPLATAGPLPTMPAPVTTLDLPAVGELSLSFDGSFSYAPPPGFIGVAQGR